MTSRPFLPKYLAGAPAHIAVWMDADTWVQVSAPLEHLVLSRRDGAVAIVEEQFGPGIRGEIDGPSGRIAGWTTLESLKLDARRAYEKCFGDEIAGRYADLPSF